MPNQGIPNYKLIAEMLDVSKALRPRKLAVSKKLQRQIGSTWKHCNLIKL
jgi:hypothetical protein